MKEPLEQIYSRARYRVLLDDSSIEVRVGEQSDALDRLLAVNGAASCALITAFNPGSRLISDQVNQARDWELQAIVSASGFASVRTVSGSKENDWPEEPGFLILAISREDAEDLGRKFGQNAILWARAGEKVTLCMLGPSAGPPKG